MPQRMLHKSWIQEWMSYFQHTEVPIPFAFWAGVWAVNCMLQDRVYLKRGNSKLYPNNYIFLVGPSGGGKSYTATQAMKMVEETNLVEVYSGKMSSSYMLSYLSAGAMQQSVLNPNLPVRARLQLYSDELALTVGSGPAGDEFLRTMTQLYGQKMQYGTHAHGSVNTEEPIINWLALATEPWLRRSIPADLIDSGFVARVITAIQGLRDDIIVPELPAMEGKLKTGLIHDLILIYGLKGEYTLSQKAQEWHHQWYTQNRQKRVAMTDKITMGMYGREDEQTLALAMTMMASAGDSMEITERALKTAAVWVTAARATNVDLYRELAEKGLRRVR